MDKTAKTDHPIHELLATRWSPYALDPRPVPKQDLLSCLEAARWAASSYNEQPWSFLVAEREDEEAFATMLGCLVEANQEWAANAGVLILACTNHRFSRNNKPNTAAVHDLGLAAGNLSLEATARGLSVHQMKGIKADHAHATYEVPEDVEVVTAIAIGYLADESDASEELRSRDEGERSRKPLSEFVFTGQWGSAFSPSA